MLRSAAGFWSPPRPDDLRAIMSAFDAPWWVAGGWAIDLFVGRQTRPHGDLDIEILRRDQHLVQEALPEWEHHGADAGTLSRWSSGATLPDTVNSVWSRPAATAPWAIQFMLAAADGDHWVYRRERRVRRRLTELGWTTSTGTPVLAPEIELLYKAKPAAQKDMADFEVAIPSTIPRIARPRSLPTS